jgi:hypothetical protein
MKTKRTFTLLGLTTLLLLAYVHEQTSIYHLSYSIVAKERKLTELNEAYKVAKFSLTEVRSPGSLSERAEAAALQLTIPQSHEVVTVFKVKSALPSAEQPRVIAHPFFSWFQFIKVAQAKTSQEG